MSIAQNEVLVKFEDKEFYGGDRVEGVIEVHVNGAPLRVKDIKWTLNITEHLNQPETDLKKARKLREKNNKRGVAAAESRCNGSPQLRGGYFKNKSHGHLLDEEDMLERGVHSFPFTFGLPENLPPSFKYGSRGLLEYELWAEVIQPRGKPLRGCKAIQVGGTIFDEDFIKQNHRSVSTVATRDITFGEGRVDLSMMLPTSIFVTGSEIVSTLIVGNHSSKQVENLSLKLKMDVHFIGDCHKKYVIRTWENKQPIAPFEGGQAFEARLKVPEMVPGTIITRKTQDKVKIGTLINCTYYVSAKAKLGFRNLKAKIPLTILRPDPIFSFLFESSSPEMNSKTSASVYSSPYAVGLASN